MQTYKTRWIKKVEDIDIQFGLFKIPSDIWYIEPWAFQVEGLREITIPRNVRKLNNVAFRGCTDLETVVFESDSCNLGNSVFSGCKKLSKITLPKQLKILPTCTFYGCESLVHVRMPDTLTRIGDQAFCGCTALESITVPDNVPYIRDAYFKNCSKLSQIYFHGHVYTYEDLLAYHKIF